MLEEELLQKLYKLFLRVEMKYIDVNSDDKFLKKEVEKEFEKIINNHVTMSELESSRGQTG